MDVDAHFNNQLNDYLDSEDVVTDYEGHEIPLKDSIEYEGEYCHYLEAQEFLDHLHLDAIEILERMGADFEF